MSKQSKNQANAAEAVAKSEVKTGAERTDLEVIADVRRHLGSGLAVTPDDQRFLLTKYDDVHALLVQSTAHIKSSTDAFQLVCDDRDRLQAIVDLAAANDNLKNAQIAELKAQIAGLQAKNDEFRDVYEQENRSQSLQVDVVDLAACGTLTDRADA